MSLLLALATGGEGELSGSTTLTFSQAGTLTGSGALFGSTTITFSPIGTLADGGTALIGSTTITFTVSGVLTGTGGEQQNSAGYGFYNQFDLYREQRRRRKKREQELLDDVREIQEKLDREIAQLLHEQQAKDADKADLKRIQELADEYAGTRQKVPRAIAATLLKAQEERSRNALEQLAREMDQMIEAEEITAVLMILNQ